MTLIRATAAEIRATAADQNMPSRQRITINPGRARGIADGRSASALMPGTIV
jgi:hypothetical protein